MSIISSRRGFTMVELLVVVAVIVVLMALLFPAIGSVRESARTAQCTSNLQQIGATLQKADQQQVSLVPPQWTAKLSLYFPGELIVLLCPDDFRAAATTTGTTTGGTSGTTPLTSYGLNSRDFRMLSGDSHKIVALDYNLVVANVVGPQGTDDWPSSVAPRHRGQVNVLLVDGSVQIRSPDAIDPRTCQAHDDLWRPIRDFSLKKLGCTAAGGLIPLPSSGTTNTASTTGGGTTTGGASTGGTTTSGSSACTTPLLNSLIARYSFDDQNNPGHDDTGNGYDATQLVGVDWESDPQHCGTIHFSKGGDTDTLDRVYLPDSLLTGRLDLTVANWFKTSSTQKQIFVSAARPDCAANELVYGLGVDTEFWFYDHCAPLIWTNSVVSGTRDGAWHHAAVVRDSTANNVTLYIDGVSLGPMSQGTDNLAFNPSPGTTMMGQEQDCPGGCFDSAQRMIGWIDDLQIYNRALSPGEIKALASGQSSGVYVKAGNGLTITLPSFATLTGTVYAWGPGSVSSAWSMLSGPGNVAFANANAAATTASFSVQGTYTLQLAATNGTQLQSDTLTIQVLPIGVAVHRYVRVMQSGNYLHLAEVQVFEAGTNHLLQTQPGAFATQSSVAFGGTPDRGNDGNTNQDWAGGSLFSTMNGQNEWWLLNLGATKTIGQITLWNRSDCCGDRLNGAHVEILDVNQNTVWTSPTIINATNGSIHEFTVP